MAKLFLTLILLVTLHGFASTDNDAVAKFVEESAKPDADGMTCIQLGFADEYFFIDHQSFPLAGFCNVRKELANLKIDVSHDKLRTMTMPFKEYEVDSLNDMQPSRVLKALAKAIAVVKADQMKTDADTVVEIHNTDKDITEVNELFKKANIDIEIPLKKGFKYYIGSTTVPEETSRQTLFWMTHFANAGMDVNDWLKIAFSIGVYKYKKGNRIYNVMVISDYQRFKLLKMKKMTDYMQAHIKDIVADTDDIEKYNN